MDLQQRVLNLELGKGVLPTEDDWIYLTHILCKTYGWTWQELKKQPIKFVLNLMTKLVKDAKKESKSMGK